MGAELATEAERIILSWVCSLLIAGEEKAAGLELIHLLLPGQDHIDRLHRYTFLNSIHLSCRGTGWCHRTAQGQYLCIAVSVCCCPVVHVLSSCLAGQELCLSHMKLVGGPFPRSVPSAGSRTHHGALLDLWDAPRCDPIPARR